MLGEKGEPLNDFTAAEVADRGVGGDAVEPGFEGQIRPGIGEGVVGFDECILGEIFGESAVADHPMEVVEYRRVVLLEEAGKGNLIARAGTPDEVSVLHGHQHSPYRRRGARRNPR